MRNVTDIKKATLRRRRNRIDKEGSTAENGENDVRTRTRGKKFLSQMGWRQKGKAKQIQKDRAWHYKTAGATREESIATLCFLGLK